MQPWLWIIAGHNGAGKSTLQPVLATMLGEACRFLNPDDVTRALLGGTFDVDNKTRMQANLEAAQWVDRTVDRLIDDGKSVAVETVLSTDKFRRRVLAAKKAGLAFGFVYIALSSADLAVRRVETRVKEGGHGVDPNKIRSRRLTSLDQMPWFAEQADVAFFFCGDTLEPVLIATKTPEHGIEILDALSLPDVTDRLAAL
ncbi:zeta toxin family protein [Magnetospirillum fulvum]|uniref:zeta toxin family protein n=1 Tax=Magnetospirillum fulvum TaxID=1082 RepID=UPI0009DC13E9|nr:zeta toxin family protein [Magnetospirillum fulvum]